MAISVSRDEISGIGFCSCCQISDALVVWMPNDVALRRMPGPTEVLTEHGEGNAASVSKPVGAALSSKASREYECGIPVLAYV